MTAVRIGFQAEEPANVRDAGQAVLDGLFPRSDVLSWLLLDWEPGTWYNPENCTGDGQVGRWVIRQMLPESRILPDLLIALKGPDPRTIGEWALQKRTGKYYWRSLAHPGLTKRKWELYREYRCEARLFWVIQGGGGGHQAFLSPLEKKIRRQLGLPPDTPAPGDLPYALPDNRVWQNLVELDQVRVLTQKLDLLQRGKEHFRREEQQAFEDFRWALYANWCHQVDAAVDERAKRWWAHARNFAPKGDDTHLKQYETTLEQFVTDNDPVGNLQPA